MLGGGANLCQLGVHLQLLGLWIGNISDSLVGASRIQEIELENVSLESLSLISFAVFQELYTVTHRLFACLVAGILV